MSLRASARFMLACAIGVACAVGSNLGGAAEPPGPAQRLPPPDHVSQETRQEVKARMARHGETMSTLVRSVVLLDRPTIRTFALRIADEELIARAGSGGQAKRPPLPREFFVTQEELSAAARQLAIAAKDGGDDNLIAERFGAVTKTCVTCHSAYVHGRPSTEPSGSTSPAGGTRK